MDSHIGDCSQPSRECEAADTEKDLNMTLSSVQNPIELLRVARVSCKSEEPRPNFSKTNCF